MPCLQTAVVSAISAAETVKNHACRSSAFYSTKEEYQKNHSSLQSSILPRAILASEPPWVVAHFPGLRNPPGQIDTEVNANVASYCCPTHDGLGKHPGLVYGRTAALKPWERGTQDDTEFTA